MYSELKIYEFFIKQYSKDMIFVDEIWKDEKFFIFMRVRRDGRREKNVDFYGVKIQT